MTMKMILIAVLASVTAVPAANAFDLNDLNNVIKQLPANVVNQNTTNTTDKAGSNNAGDTKIDPATVLLGALKQNSVDDEVQIGRQLAGNLLGASPLVKDARLQHYVNEVGRWVALQSERPDLPWQFGVIESNDINAFSAPGGYVFITKGLYRKLNNESELAGVLGHEIAHVVRKHQLKIMQQSQFIGLGAQALGREVNGQQTIQNLIGSGAEIMSRKLDKNAEFEADRMGLVLAARAGYDAYGLPAVLEEIGHVAPGDSSVALLFKTHPAPDVRFSMLSEAVGDRLDNLPPGKELANRFYHIK
ncbi:MAG: M48 family metalloprotease [Sulfuriferula sp.]|nr:M48 family metalloprotease [Sulfuriferula sp.]